MCLHEWASDMESGPCNAADAWGSRLEARGALCPARTPPELDAKPPTRFRPRLSEEMCLCAAAVAPISGNGLVGSLLTTDKPAVTVGIQPSPSLTHTSQEA